jgi:hypothetical protein
MNQRHDIVRLAKDNPIGIELGVAEGVFSHMVLSNVPVNHWYSVDMWAGDRGHDDQQHKRAIQKLSEFKHKNTIIKARFDEAILQFEDNFFDFIYVDGYAHTGQESGKTLYDWWPKLKSGGIFAGDDYDKKWPLTIAAVDNFCVDKKVELNIFNFQKMRGDPWSNSPSWYVVK